MARFGGQPFTPHEDALVDRMVADGWAFDRIADALGRPSRASVRHRYVKRQAAREAAAMARALAARAKHRHCGMCGLQFLSQHAGVRRCDPCRGLSVSPFEPEHDCGIEILDGIPERGPVQLWNRPKPADNPAESYAIRRIAQLRTIAAMVRK